MGGHGNDSTVGVGTFYKFKKIVNTNKHIKNIFRINLRQYINIIIYIHSFTISITLNIFILILIYSLNKKKSDSLCRICEFFFTYFELSELTAICISLLHTLRSCSLLTYIRLSAYRPPEALTKNTIANPPVK
ncbi:hypothetical protein PUN28_003318 [Cardiocondyla obscurior]|uniref:Uncharacterized protein n=1 Tax=Cardiocondyla obscurior TaxID=286306 RepID=A0AAW2GLP8_9HYME